TTSLLVIPLRLALVLSFFFTDTAPADIYTLSLHDALPICFAALLAATAAATGGCIPIATPRLPPDVGAAIAQHPMRKLETDDLRSEEHTSELQSLTNLVCRLLLEKKKQKPNAQHDTSSHTH